MIIWSEPAGHAIRDGPNFSSTPLGARIFSETRRFVVVQSKVGHSLCCPIHTYQKRGTTSRIPRVNYGVHAVVHVAGTTPKLLPGEEPPGMGNFPIVLEDRFVTVEPSSRLNFGKVYTVEHNTEVRNVGKISKESVPSLRSAFLKVLMGFDTSDADTEAETEVSYGVFRPSKTQRESAPLSSGGSLLQYDGFSHLSQGKSTPSLGQPRLDESTSNVDMNNDGVVSEPAPTQYALNPRHVSEAPPYWIQGE